MRVEELDFDLPAERIARFPLPDRDQARLMQVSCAEERRDHRTFAELPTLLQDGDLLVLNDTSVVAARLCLRKVSGGLVEGLWLESLDGARARCMLSGSRLRAGVELGFEDQPQDCAPLLRLVERENRGRWVVESLSGEEWRVILARHGATPLPPYIRSLRREAGQAEDSAADRQRYQTVWADQPGSVAAPTASLHFCAETLAELHARGVRTTYLTLHVGLGTFLPVSCERVEDHPIHAERFAISAAACAELVAARRRGGRIVAAGTTVCRVLESLPQQPSPCAAETGLYLLPGHRFRWTDGLLTNFHTPRSTLLALVAAFAAHAGSSGLPFVHACYRAAIERNYRFYSYGDASLWLP